MCNTLASFFAASYSMDVNVDNLINMNLSNKDDVLHTLCSICFAESQVLHRLESLDSSKGAGADEIPSAFLSTVLILNMSNLSAGIFPSLWKSGLIVPVHKAVGIRKKL